MANKYSYKELCLDNSSKKVIEGKGGNISPVLLVGDIFRLIKNNLN